MATARELNEIAQLESLGKYLKVTQKASSNINVLGMQGQRDPATGKIFTSFAGGGTGQAVNLSNAGGIAYGETLPGMVKSGGTVYVESKNK
ncbi:MAG TPA: hypothetical protein VIQ31_35760 [Phormidium sp.]